MKRNLKNEGSKERKLIAKCIFKGFTIAQIARELNYSPSTVSNRMAELFKAYNAKTKLEFVIKSFGQIIKHKSMLLSQKDKEIKKLLSKIEYLETKLDALTKPDSKTNSKK